MSDKPGLVIDEPQASGWLRAEFYGDVEAAKGYIVQARQVLGRMKTRYGVNARTAEGEPGGFFRDNHVLPDGTRIEALTNDGHDTLRITVPTARSESVAPPSAQGASTSFEGTPTGFAFTPEPLPEPREVVVKPPVVGFKPYLWIGARIVSGGQQGTSTEKKLHVCVWEPAAPGTDPVILSNRNDFITYDWNDPARAHYQPPSVYPLQYWTQFIPAGDFYTGIAYTDDKLCMVLPNNHYGLPMRVPDYNPDVDENVVWDVIFIADPDNDLQLSEGGVSMEATGDGEYTVKVMVVGPDCQPRATMEPIEVELRIIVGKDEDAMDLSTRFTIGECTEYRMGIAPKGYFGAQFGHASDPCIACSETPDDYGDNPHGPHWWQGAGTAYVPPRQIDVPPEQFIPPVIDFSRVGEVLLPPTGFVPAGFPSRADRCGACATATTRFGGFTMSTGLESTGPYSVQQFTQPISESANPVFDLYGLPHATTWLAGDPATGRTVSWDCYAAPKQIIGSASWAPDTQAPQIQQIEYDEMGWQFGATYGAWYKYTTVTDQNNTVIGRTAQWISLAEYTAKPSSGLIETCTRAEQD